MDEQDNYREATEQHRAGIADPMRVRVAYAVSLTAVALFVALLLVAGRHW